MGCYYQFCLCQEGRPSLTEEETQRSIWKIELDELRKQNIQEKSFQLIEMYENDWWKITRQIILEQRLREPFPCKIPLREERPLENIKTGSLFGYVQCDIEVPRNLREAFANFPTIFMKINVGKDDIGLFMKEYAKKEGFFEST